MATGVVTGDASTGTDTLRSIESVRGSAFADSYTATGFSGSSANAGNNGTFNEFEGMAGNDTVVGNGATRISFTNASGGITVDLQAGNVVGNSSVGTDTVSGISQVRGSNFGDTISGGSGNDFFDGRAGNDLLDGRAGFDQVVYNADTLVTAGITVNMAAGTVTGDATVGTDTLRSIEQVTGTNFADTYDATGFSASSTNAGSNGTFNSFQGAGGNDIITGNGNTQIAFSNATGNVTVDLAAGTATGDASVGSDTIHRRRQQRSGLQPGRHTHRRQQQRSARRRGRRRHHQRRRRQRHHHRRRRQRRHQRRRRRRHGGLHRRDRPVHHRDGELGCRWHRRARRHGHAQQHRGASIRQRHRGDILSDRERELRTPVDVTGLNFSGTAGLSSLTGASDDFLTIGQNFFGRPINLGAGTGDTVNLGVAGAGYTLALVDVENLNGSGGNEFVTLSNLATSMSINLGVGTDTLVLANGANSISATGIEQINGTDFSGSSNDTLTLQNNVSGVSVNLANGSNTLSLASGANQFNDTFSVGTINGSSFDDTLSITGSLFNNGNAISVDLGSGEDT